MNLSLVHILKRYSMERQNQEGNSNVLDGVLTLISTLQLLR
jgi:hypothetical protein